jgi:two-component system sensor histidine kinase MprB
MTLRTRLAVALALLAALSVAAVAGISYVATDQRLHDEVDASLVSAALQLPPQADDDFCHDLGLNRPLPGLFPGLAMVVQCLDSSGRVTQARGPLGVPIDRPGVDVTARTVRPLAAPGDDGHPSGGGGRELAGPWTQTFGGQAYRVVAIPRLGGGEVRVARSLAETDRVLGSLRNRSILVGLVIIALAAVAGALIARRTTRPVTRLSGAAEEIAATGRMDIAVPTGGRDEIGRLARAFSSMLAALTRSRDQQQRLVQDAGHELRTPLTSLRTNIDTLRRYPDLAGEPRERILGDLSSELRELSALVDELVALAERAADRTRRRSGRGVLVDAEPAAVAARPQALLRAVGNLLDNAVKFSPDATPVEVTVRPGSLQVRDHGPGIAAEDLPYVFDRFYRALGARSLPGSGLGLAIVRQVAEGAGGTVQVANHPDGGAVFTLRLPPAPAAPDPTSAS